MLRKRTTVSRLAVLALTTAIASACTDATDPMKVAPTAPLEAKGHSGFTHPAGVLSQTVPLGGTWGIALSSTGIVLAAQPSNNTIGGFSLSDPTTLRPTLTVDGWPLDIIANAKGTLAYVSSGSTGNVDVIDIKSNTKVDTIPLAPNIDRLRLSVKESRIYATTLDGRLWGAPLKGGKKVKAAIDLTNPWNNVNGGAIAPSGSDLYASSTAGYVWRLDPETLEIRASATIPWIVQDIAVSPDGSVLWAAAENGAVLKLDPMTLAITAIIPVGFGYGGPFGLAISPDGQRVYAAASQSGTIYIVSEPTPNTFDVSSIFVGGDPRRIAFSADGATAVVSNYYGGVHIIQ
jgi:DNA-binding beta-propeller fold protein YncE